MYDEGLVSDGFMMEFLQTHTNVIYQPPYNSDYFSGINPYALGFAMMTDLRRICEHPTEEDKYWFPDCAGSEWTKCMDFAMKNFKDESFIAQYLSPKLIRDLKLFSVLDDDTKSKLEITAIHDDQGYRHVRQCLAEQYNLGSREPNIQIFKANQQGDRSLILRHSRHNRRPLGESTDEVLKHIARLWRFNVYMETVHENNRVELTHECRV